MVRRLTAIVILAVLLTLSLVSCGTTGTNGYTQEEGIYAMRLAISTAQTETLSKIYNGIQDGKLHFIPSDLSILIEKSDEIPGMGILIDTWSGEVSQPIMDAFDSFRTLTDGIIAKTEFADAISAAVEISNTSGTDTFERLYGGEVRAFVYDTLSCIDLKPLTDCINQYNSWVRIRFLMDGTDVGNQIEMPTDEQLLDSITEHIASVYFSSLANAEELYRTTPDPYADEIAAKVFGLY